MMDTVQTKSRTLSRNLRANGWKKRRNYPSDLLVAGLMRTIDGKVVTLYADRSFLVRDTFGGK